MGDREVARAGTVVRALLVAGEDDAAELTALRRWMIERGGARAEDVIVCAGPGCAERTFGNTRAELAAAVRRLVADGADRTDVLYVYLAGRGARVAGSPFSRAADVVAGLPVMELQARLALALGPGAHVHVVDAQPAAAAAVEPIDPAALDLEPRRSPRGTAEPFALMASGGGLGRAVRLALEAEEHAATGATTNAAQFARVAAAARAQLGAQTVEVVGLDGDDGAADRATRRAIELGERILRPEGPEPRTPQTSALCLLATFSDASRAHETWLGPARLRPAAWASGAAERWIEVRPGAQTFALAVPGWEPFEIASCALFGHVTVIVLSDDGDGRLDVRQLLVPAPHLVGRVPGPLRHPRRALRFMAEAQRRLARRLPIVAGDDAWERARWDDLVTTRWVDPVLSLVAAYELLRRGGDGAAGAVAAIVRALRTRYPELPDTDVLAAAVGIEAYPVTACPLFLDGALTLPPPLRPPDGLLAEGAWTTLRSPAPPAPARRAL